MHLLLNKQKLYISLLFTLFSIISNGQPQRPNIVIFMVDDMGWQDCSLPFWKEKTSLNRQFHTPSMEKLAAEGMKFTNAYATPVCTPTRISMLTGMNAAHHRVTNWTSPLKDNPTDNSDQQFGVCSWNYNGLSPRRGIAHTVLATPLPQLLKDAGYFTVHIGKAHWGSNGTPGSSPANLGFMINVAGNAAGHPQSYLSEENYGNTVGKAGLQAVPDLQEYYGSGTFLTEALTLEALKAIEDPITRKQPFFLHLAHYAVHVPIMADKRFFQKYLNNGLDSIEAAYATLIEGMDKSLGDVMQYLKKKGVERNTIIIFMSDNGGLSNPGSRGGVRAYTHNLPLKAGKGSVYEGGIREPMIVKWPGVAKPGTTAEQYVIIEDFFPTILKMAGIKKYSTLQKIDGISFIPVLRNPDYLNNERPLLWHTPNKWIPNDGPGINYFSAIRQGKWKLIYSYRTGKAELYDLSVDIGEQNDLSKSETAQSQKMIRLLTAELKKYNAQVPVDKRTGIAVGYPK
jgi:arylsulfatase A-like enzyme